MPDRSICAKATSMFNGALLQDKIELFSLLPKFCLQCEISIFQGGGPGEAAKALRGEGPRPRASWELLDPESPRVWPGRASGSGSRPRFNCTWTRSMAPAAREEPLGGSETRLKQLACCRHIVLRQGRGYRGRLATVPWLTKPLALAGPARRGGGDSARRCAPSARARGLRPTAEGAR